MPSSPFCPFLQSSLEALRLLKQEFHVAYDLAVFSENPHDLAQARTLKHTLETKTQELQKEVNFLEVEHVYDLRAQYERQVTLLKTTGLLETRISTDETGKEQEVCFMTDIHHTQYPVPSYETLVERLSSEQKELLRTKADQGFKKFLLVPFGMSLDDMIIKFRAYLLGYKKEHSEFGRLDPTIEDLSDRPSWDPCILKKNGYKGADVQGTLVYEPKWFGSTNHGGVTKTQILERQKATQDSTTGWRVLLLQGARDGAGFKEIPREGKGEIQGKQLLRKDIEAGKNPLEYLAQELAASNDPSSPYHGESGMTPEESMVMFMSHLQETGKPMDDFHNNIDSGAYLTGAYFTSSKSVPMVCWDWNEQWFRSEKRDQDFDNIRIGVRCVVRT